MKSNNEIVNTILKALLQGRILNRKDFNNGSLHSWISTLRNQRLIPVESSQHNADGTCDYFMLPIEIQRYKDPELRKAQQTEMKFIVECERQQELIAQFHKLLERLIQYPSLWRVWEELPLRLDQLAKEINALLGQEKSVNQNSD